MKEKGSAIHFLTGVDFAAGTATNGSPTTVNSTDLFNPALVRRWIFGCVRALEFAFIEWHGHV